MTEIVVRGCSGVGDSTALQSTDRLLAADTRPPESLGVLIVAENASMDLGGEMGLAVRWFLGLLKEGIDVHLLVHDRCKPELDQSLSRFNSRIHYVPDVLIQKICWKL